jgi:hypothetical protein
MVAASAAHAETPTLYQRIASGSLVVHGRCFAVGKRASILVLENLKGKYATNTLQVAYRSDNYNRQPGVEKIVFVLGAESILVLNPELSDDGVPKGPDRFLAGGSRGKIDLPAEGGPAVLQAAERLTSIMALGDQTSVWTAQRELIRETNPILVGAGFEEILKFRLGDESIAMPLVTHIEGPRPEFQRSALKVLAQMFEKQKRTGQSVASSDLLLQEAITRASGDESPETRVEAVKALRALGRPDLAEIFGRIASSDPSQLVRYEAQIALKELPPPPASPAAPGNAGGSGVPGPPR